jgi:hypothetical protein
MPLENYKRSMTPYVISLLLFKPIGAMLASILAAVTSLEMVGFGKNHKAVFKVKINSFLQRVR